jgi:SAM-dependent methyltransferase
MQKRHLDNEQYFLEQSYTAKKYIIPFIEPVTPINSSTFVLEVGTNKGGNMEEFINSGCTITGVDINSRAINFANDKFRDITENGKAKFICEDIYKVKLSEKYDLIFLKDTLEHIPHQDNLLKHLKSFLKPNGRIFLAFPPWQMPFGGHQQMSSKKLLNICPYVHLLPGFLYFGIMKLFGENKNIIEELKKIKETRISIQGFLKILKTQNYNIDKVDYYFINPNYEVKFKMKPRKLSKLIASIPYLRNFFITTCYYLISQKNN